MQQMNIYIFLAGVLCLILGIAHSILGELFIFKHKRKKGNLVPSKSSTDLKERHLRIIWATWHLATFFGCCFGAILVKISFAAKLEPSLFTLKAISYTMFFAAVLVLIGTKGKHPGWLVLLIVVVLLQIAT